MVNRWVRVTAVFYNGVPDTTHNELYIDGVKQVLVQGIGVTTATVTVTPKFYISGWGPDSHYRFSGKLGNVRIWNRALTPSEIQLNPYKTFQGTENGLIGSWKAY
ncbi:LamG-like jellyroll fold domain-containing protein [Paenibacillus baimaensis]|uniref:LamG-like jellyroll fold domain-containing protein n=1 Tax=Paenibacillus baimaensis TaxID=2982185 RepID=UPI0038CD17CE